MYLSLYSCDLSCVRMYKRSRLQRRLHPCHPLPPTKRRPQACAFQGAPLTLREAQPSYSEQPPLQPSLQHPEPRRPPPRPLSVNCPILSHLREHTACGRVARAARKGFALLFTPRAQGRHSYSHPEPRGITPIHTQSPGASPIVPTSQHGQQNAVRWHELYPGSMSCAPVTCGRSTRKVRRGAQTTRL